MQPSATTLSRTLGLVLLFGLAAGLGACDGDDDNNGSGGGGGGPGVGPPPPRSASRAYRAIAGVSMGGYGAMNLGTKRADLFGVIGSLGGPVDMLQLIAHMLRDNLEVKPQTGIPRLLGEDFTLDHLPPYPDRGTRMVMARDLFIAFGNPFLHHPDPQRPYLAVDSQPAQTMFDDQFGAFTPTAGPRGFLDGGDANEDGLRQTNEPPDEPTDVLLMAGGTATPISGQEGLLVGERELIDLDADGVFDVGDGVVVNLSEPLQEQNGNLVFEPALGETFQDFGLDGVPSTGDLGEANAVFDYDPDRATWVAQDPVSRLLGRTQAEILAQRIYMDVGTEDEFGFAAHYDSIVAVLQAKGLPVTVQNGFGGNCTSVPEPQEQYLLVRYDGGHIGIPGVDDIQEQLLNGNFCEPLAIWQRLLTLIGYANESFARPVNGPTGLRLVGEVVTQAVPSPALTPPGQPTVQRTVVVYLPPAYFNSSEQFPIVYFLGGYGQDPTDFERIGLLMDVLIAAGEVQNMYFAFLPGDGGFKGSFYVNQAIPPSLVPTLGGTTGRYEDSIIEDLIPFIEDNILQGRIRFDP